MKERLNRGRDAPWIALSGIMPIICSTFASATSPSNPFGFLRLRDGTRDTASLLSSSRFGKLLSVRIETMSGGRTCRTRLRGRENVSDKDRRRGLRRTGRNG